MEKHYCVTVQGKAAGKVTVRLLGLYYYFSCRCQMTDKNIYRLIVTCGNKKINLGILIPEAESFILNTKLPVKKFAEGEMIFTLIPKEENISNKFVPIVPDEPFSYISRLKGSFLTLQDGQPGIHVSKMQEQ